ncbi:hypothetical protein PPL_10492 [Heterostelium album PN500]|uniref:Uncharacterized protein n=1 Tax=Heterostelium pallidum (strain ATCC 26659 / Pp 5 / PN500) TaxID=670386 RepID=D3BR88_HETP5|nr:hypothetical protein PPL_10492 [Heterostelium album PN500]EFA75920.1 hypothetical protein PPL_10492 [Heterostelium album PN500]|eukprot:XP_020428054.1 hypothetical protein PPL_10492 [Heterostelium album PN500]
MMQHRRVNFTAVYALERLLSTSLGPKGLDKVIVDSELHETTITNDGATIIDRLPLENPLAVILKQLAHSVDSKVGDGTTSAVLLACRLLASADRLLDERYHPNLIVEGFQQALQLSLKIFDRLAITLESHEQSMLLIASTTLQSKILSSYSNKFSKLCLSAINIINNNNNNNNNDNNNKHNRNNIDNIKYLKILGGSIADTSLIHGIMIKTRFLVPNMSKSVKNARLLFIDFELGDIGHSISLLPSSLSFNQRESIEKERKELEIKQSQIIINYLSNSGQCKIDNCIIISTKRIPSSCIAMFYNHSVHCSSMVDNNDMSQLLMISGGTLLHSLVQLDIDSSSNKNNDNNNNNINITPIVSECRELVEKNSQYYLEIINNDVTINSICTFIVRGPNLYTIEEVQRSLNDALSVMSIVRDYPTVLPGGGATEIQLSIQINHYLKQQQTQQSHSQSQQLKSDNIKINRIITLFSESLLTIPTLLYRNAGFDSTTLLSEVMKFHEKQHQLNNNNNSSNIDYKTYSVDLDSGEIKSMLSLGIVEPINAKKNMLSMVVDTVSMLNHFETQPVSVNISAPVGLVRLFVKDKGMTKHFYSAGVSLTTINKDLGLSRGSLIVHGDVNKVVVEPPFPAGDYDLYNFNSKYL